MTHAGGDIIAGLLPNSSFAEKWTRYRKIQGLVSMAALGGAGVLGMVSIARVSPRAAKMIQDLLPGFVDRVIKFLANAKILYKLQEFQSLSPSEQQMIHKAFLKRQEIGHVPNSNVATALVRKKNPATGEWESIPEPYVARNGMLHSESELINKIDADMAGQEYEITHLFTERTPCVRDGCSTPLSVTSERQTRPIQLIDFDIPEGFGSVGEVYERWRIIAKGMGWE